MPDASANSLLDARYCRLVFVQEDVPEVVHRTISDDDAGLATWDIWMDKGTWLAPSRDRTS